MTKKKVITRNNKVKYIQCNLNNHKNILNKLKSQTFNYIINFSGNINHYDKKDTFEAHYRNLVNIVKYIKKTRSDLLIQIGSSLEYGKRNSPHIESAVCKPVSNYGKAKNLASEFIKKNLSNYIILRPYQIYGPFQKKDRLIPITIDSCLKKKKFACTEGSQKRDFLFVEDFINLIKIILQKKKIKTGIYNVGLGKPVKVKKIINLIVKIIREGKPLFGKLKMRKDEIKILYPNITKVKKTFNWKPKTSLKFGLQKTIRYYKNSKC